MLTFGHALEYQYGAIHSQTYQQMRFTLVGIHFKSADEISGDFIWNIPLESFHTVSANYILER